jgi:hypothetical protein
MYPYTRIGMASESDQKILQKTADLKRRGEK